MIKLSLEIIKRITQIIYVLMIFIVLMQVFLRYVFNSPLIWPEELTLLLFIWLTFLGAALIFYDKEHFSVDIILKTMPGIFGYILNIFHTLIELFVIIIFIISGYQIILASWGQALTATRIPWLFYYFPLPLVSILMLVYHFFRKDRE